jgi:hypothetical protein
MDTMNEELMTIADRIAKKNVAVNVGRKKINNLQTQVDMYTNTIERVTAENEQKLAEIDDLKKIEREALTIVAKVEVLSKYTDGLRKKFSEIEWRPDLAWEEKLESTDYHEKVAEKFELIDELQELVKRANKIYYRR